LRCYLRQDPDIILVGEIRDTETAEIAIEAALTGHLLFSTLHTNDAPSTIARFDEMGIEPFMISTCLVAICAQRLLRRLCSCKQYDDPKPDERILLERALDDHSIEKIIRPVGCEKCAGSGYKGRLGTHELLKNSDDLRALINRHGTVEQLKQAAREAGMRTIFEDLMEKVNQGLTSLEEAIATARPDDTPNPLKAKGIPIPSPSPSEKVASVPTSPPKTLQTTPVLQQAQLSAGVGKSITPLPTLSGLPAQPVSNEFAPSTPALPNETGRNALAAMLGLSEDETT
jgi:hypothetical protein